MFINTYWFYIETYYDQRMSQTALQSIINPADQLIPYIEMLSLQTLRRNAFKSP